LLINVARMESAVCSFVVIIGMEGLWELSLGD